MNIWRTFKHFSGFDLHLRSIINVIPSVLCLKLWDTFHPDLFNFKILFYNFVYNVKVYIKLSGKHTSWTLIHGLIKIMFQHKALLGFCIILKTFWGNRASQVSSFTSQYSICSYAVTYKANPPQGCNARKDIS